MAVRPKVLISLLCVPLIATVALVTTDRGEAARPRTVEAFTTLLATGVHADYTPLESPVDAVRKADLVVSGTLAEVTDGVSITYADAEETRSGGSPYVTFVVDVATVLSGPPGKVVGGRVYVQVPRSPAIPTSRFAEANPRSRVLLVLDDITTWQPQPGATVTRPQAVPAGAPLYVAYTDGTWLQGATDTVMYGIGAHADDLAPAWSGVATLDGFAAAIVQSAAS